MRDGFFISYFSGSLVIGKKTHPKLPKPETNLDEMEEKIYVGVSSELIPHLDVAVYLGWAHEISFTLPRQVL